MTREEIGSRLLKEHSESIDPAETAEVICDTLDSLGIQVVPGEQYDSLSWFVGFDPTTECSELLHSVATYLPNVVRELRKRANS